jgi:hypothetical protein
MDVIYKSFLLPILQSSFNNSHFQHVFFMKIFRNGTFRVTRALISNKIVFYEDFFR